MKRIALILVLCILNGFSYAQTINSKIISAQLSVQNVCYTDYKTNRIVPLKIYAVGGKLLYTNCENDYILKTIPLEYVKTAKIWKDCSCIAADGGGTGPITAISALKIENTAFSALTANATIKNVQGQAITLAFSDGQSITTPLSDYSNAIGNLSNAKQKVVLNKFAEYMNNNRQQVKNVTLPSNLNVK